MEEVQDVIEQHGKSDFTRAQERSKLVMQAPRNVRLSPFSPERMAIRRLRKTT